MLRAAIHIVLVVHRCIPNTKTAIQLLTDFWLLMCTIQTMALYYRNTILSARINITYDMNNI